MLPLHHVAMIIQDNFTLASLAFRIDTHRRPVIERCKEERIF
jgi:hypothetical protein